jgi:hypothetical protein
MVKRENGEEITPKPIEPGRDKILPRFGYFPGEQRPRHTVHREPAQVEVKQWRRRIQIHLLSGGTIPYCGKPVRPWVEKRDSGGAPLRGGGLEVLHPP